MGFNFLIRNRQSGGDLTFGIKKGEVETNVMTIDGATGNVGIGTTSPANLLHVNGSGRFETDALVGRSGGGSVKFGAGSLSYIYGQDTTLQLKSNGNLGIGIDSDGNVGIGTTSPGAKLDVAGAILSTGTTAPSSGVGLATYYDGAGCIIRGYNYDTPAWKNIYIDSLETFINGYSGGAVGIGYNTLIGTTGKLLVNGNVGIGTTSPEEVLHVEDTAGTFSVTPLRLSHSRTASTNNIISQSFFMKNDGGESIEYATIAVKSTAIAQAANQEAGRMSFNVKQLGSDPYSTERMVIQGDGKVGIELRVQAN